MVVSPALSTEIPTFRFVWLVVCLDLMTRTDIQLEGKVQNSSCFPSNSVPKNTSSSDRLWIDTREPFCILAIWFRPVRSSPSAVYRLINSFRSTFIWFPFRGKVFGTIDITPPDLLLDMNDRYIYIYTVVFPFLFFFWSVTLSLVSLFLSLSTCIY